MNTKLFRALCLAVFACLIMCVIGCSKDAVLGFANCVMTNLGDNVLTKSYNLAGCRLYGTDSYTGSYRASYEQDTTHEVLFGNTCMLRPEGEMVHLEACMEQTAGTGRLVVKQGSSDPVTLLETSGSVSEDIHVEGGSTYIAFDCDEFTGTLDIDIS